MVGEVVKNLQIPYSFNDLILIYEYIHSHSRHIFIHIQGQFFIQRGCYIHSTFSAHPSLRIIGPLVPAVTFRTRDLPSM